MQERGQKYIWGFWIISFVITSIFYMGCSGEKPFGNKEEIAGQMSLALQQKDMYCQKKLERIDSIRNFLNVNEKRMADEEKFLINANLYNEFKLYSFDSAFHYATQLCKIASVIDSAAYMVNAKTKLGYILARGGFFKEAIDSLSSIRIEKETLPAQVLADYYISFGRVYHDLADYAKDDVFSSKYNQIGNELLTESQSYLSDSSTIYYVRGKIALKEDLEFNL